MLPMFKSKRLFNTLVQRIAPEFSCKAVQDGRIVTLNKSDLLRSPLQPDSQGYAMMIFYPLDFTFVCPTELTAYADRLEEFQGENCRVVGVSVDSEYSHLTWSRQPRNQGGLLHDKKGFKMALLSDLSKEVSRSYGVLSENGQVALRAQILLDPRGIVRHVGVNDLGIGRSVDESLRLLRAVRFVDENGGEAVCPANWKPGDASINPKASDEYFKGLK